MIIEPVAPNRAKEILGSINMDIGYWSRIVFLDRECSGFRTEENYEGKPIESATNIVRTALHWLGGHEWKLIQFDDTRGFNVIQNALINPYLFGLDEEKWKDLDRAGVDGAFLCHVGSQKFSRCNTDLIVSNIMAMSLVWSIHCGVVADGVHDKLLETVDGFLYFCGSETAIAEGWEIYEHFCENPDTEVQWVTQALIDQYED